MSEYCEVVSDRDENFIVSEPESEPAAEDETATESAPAPAPAPAPVKSITIDGTTYDITNFDHPGGNVINYACGQDATDVFREFHYRSKSARRVLQTLPRLSGSGSGCGQDQCQGQDLPEMTPRQQEMTNDFREMRTTLVNNGCFDADLLHVYFRLMEITFYFGLGAFLAAYNVYASLLSFIVFKTRCGWVQHEAGHLSLTGIKKIDHFIQTVTMGFGGGVSSSVWNSMHNKHHATPQKIKHDIDLDTTPAVAFFKTAFEENTNGPKSAKYMNRLWMRFQAWSFLPVVNGLFVHLFWTYYLHPRKVLGLGMGGGGTKTKTNTTSLSNVKILEATCMALSHFCIPAIFYSYGGHSLITSYFLLMICNFWNFVYLFGHFSLSHTFTDVIPENKNLLWFEYGIRHSVNISTKSQLIGWIMGYLNFQIEHHLFPSMPQYKNAMAAPYVRRFCEKWHNSIGDGDLKYKEISYFQAWLRMFSNLNEVGKHYYENGIDADHEKLD